MVIVPFPIPTSMVDRELDALIEQSREQRLKLLDPPAWCIEAFGPDYVAYERGQEDGK